jgi:hypothetical protein
MFGKKKATPEVAPEAAIPEAPELIADEPKSKKAKKAPKLSSGSGMKVADILMILGSGVLFAAVVIEMLAAKALMVF